MISGWEFMILRREVSGIRKAEMKWTNPERLSLYGVRMVGWPSDIPAANPSSLKASQNQRLLELVEQGELKFEKTMVTGLEGPPPSDTSQSTHDTAEDFSWVYDAEGSGGIGVGGISGTTTAAKSISTATPSHPLGPSQYAMLSGSAGVLAVNENSMGSPLSWEGDNDDLLAAERPEGAGFDEYGFVIEPWNDGVQFEELEDDGPVEPRARKRARSTESEDR